VQSRFLLLPLFLLLYACPMVVSQVSPEFSPCVAPAAEIVAVPVSGEIRLNAAYPAAEWETATSVTFCTDWQGKNRDRTRQTQVRLLWSPQTLYIRLECHYRELHLPTGGDFNGRRRDDLWDGDAANVFLQPDPSHPLNYKEIGIAANGLWTDLDVSPAHRDDLSSGLKRSMWVDPKTPVWVAELAIPIKSLTPHFDPKKLWRVNFTRIEGAKESLAYLAWHPTNTPKPDFHVPRAFGRLRFALPQKPKRQQP
jgi:alpha-galactosidase